METSYAQALWKMIAGGMAPGKAVHALRDKLVADGRQELLPRIGKAFARIAETELKRSGAFLTVARESDARTAEKEAKEVLAKLKIESKSLKTVVDDSLIGGWRLEAGDHLVDASHKKQLLDIYNKAVAA